MARALRGSGLGGQRAAHLPDPTASELAPRQILSYWCAADHESTLAFAHDAVAPETADCKTCGAPAGPVRETPPSADVVAPYKTHLQYMQERRSNEDAEALLTEALAGLRERRK